MNHEKKASPETENRYGSYFDATMTVERNLQVTFKMPGKLEWGGEDYSSVYGHHTGHEKLCL